MMTNKHLNRIEAHVQAAELFLKKARDLASVHQEEELFDYLEMQLRPLAPLLRHIRKLQEQRDLLPAVAELVSQVLDLLECNCVMEPGDDQVYCTGTCTRGLAKALYIALASELPPWEED